MLKIKVCGMKYPDNILQLAELQIDYMGFIFYEKSKRFVGDSIESFLGNNFPKHIKKVGVFVNSSVETILSFNVKYSFDYIQLHGNESPEFCQKIVNNGLKVIKAFQVSEEFDFSECEKYQNVSDFFLFDTKTVEYGGSGTTFNWKLLENYTLDKRFLLSGGISLENVEQLKLFSHSKLHALDLNSKFELSAGLKDISKLKIFLNQLKL